MKCIAPLFCGEVAQCPSVIAPYVLKSSLAAALMESQFLWKTYGKAR
jgi:hypothetical protein